MDVPVTDAGVETTSFLEASEGLVKMFGTVLLSVRVRVAGIDENDYC